MTLGDCTFSYYPVLPGFETPWSNNGPNRYIGDFVPITLGSGVYTCTNGGNIRVGGLRTCTNVFLQFESKPGYWNCSQVALTVNGDITVKGNLTSEATLYGINPTGAREDEFIRYFEANVGNTIKLVMSFF